MHRVMYYSVEAKYLRYFINKLSISDLLLFLKNMLKSQQTPTNMLKKRSYNESIKDEFHYSEKEIDYILKLKSNQS